MFTKLLWKNPFLEKHSCEKSKIVSLDSWRMKKIVAFPTWSKFTVKLICWITLETAWRSACCLLKSIAINLP